MALQPRSRDRIPKDAAEILAGLEEGLSYLPNAPGYNNEAEKALATELQKLLFNGPTTPAHRRRRNSRSRAKPTRKVDHTDVPPPLPLSTIPQFLPRLPATYPTHASPSVNVGRSSYLERTGREASGLHAACALPPITGLSLLSAPFTHTSTLPHYMVPTGTNTYEPLEFLGDAYLGTDLHASDPRPVSSSQRRPKGWPCERF